MSINEMLMAAAGSAGGDVNYIDDCFATHLYTGNGSTQTINNGIDLAGKGGLVWGKCRSSAFAHNLIDTVRGNTQILFSNTTNGNFTSTDTLTSFNGNGFTLGADTGSGGFNLNGDTYCSWTFREQAKFMDVVTFTGDGGTTQSISHSLSSIPRFIIVKSTSNAANWKVLAWDGTNYQILYLNLTNAGSSAGTLASYVSSTAIDFGGISTNIESGFNTSGQTYVAYLFAHDAGGFGAAGTDNVISCGSYTTDGSGNATVSLGYEPQFFLSKESGAAGDSWYIEDVMRGFNQTASALLQANSSAAEASVSTYDTPTATGVNVRGRNSSATYIYMAIRRPMKPPTSGTQVFLPSVYAGSSSVDKVITTGFTVDMTLARIKDAAVSMEDYDRLRGNSARLETNSTGAEASAAALYYDLSDKINFRAGFNLNLGGYNHVAYNFRRATGFMDVVCYSGSGTARTVAHNLGVVPELMILKARSTAGAWTIYHSALGATKYLEFNTSAENTGTNRWNDTAPTSSVFTIGTTGTINTSGTTYVAYLFASIAGVSKVGSYTGNGSSQTINCGFTAGARFVLIKRTDSTGDWVVLDTARGIVSGNDPFLQLNSTAAEVTGEDIVDPANSGFIVNETTEAINTNAATYIFLAIA